MKVEGAVRMFHHENAVELPYVLVNIEDDESHQLILSIWWKQKSNQRLSTSIILKEIFYQRKENPQASWAPTHSTSTRKSSLK